MNNFVVEIWKKFELDTDLNSYKLPVFFKPNKVLTRQKILPGDSKNSTVDGQSQLIPCGDDKNLPYLPCLPSLPTLPTFQI